MSEQFLAEAQILITPNTSTFRTLLLAELEKVEKTAKVKVLMVPNTKGFREALRAAVITSSTGVTAKVLVRPDMTGFRAALQEAVTAASRGVTAPVTATAARATGRAAAATVATGGVVDKRVAEAQRAVNTAVDTGIAARRRLATELSTEEKLATRVARAELQLKTANDAVTRSLTSGNAALILQAEELQRVARASHEAAVGAQERAITGAPTGIVAQQAAQRDAEKAAQADLIAAKELAAKEFERIEAEQTAALASAVTEREAFYAKEVADAEAAATAITTEEKNKSAALLTERRRADIAAEKAFDKQLATQLAAQKRASELSRRAGAQLAGVTTFTPQITEVPETSGASRGVVAAQNEVLRARAQLAHATEVVATAEEAFDATLLTSDNALKGNAVETLANARANEVLQAQLVKTALSQEAAAKAAARGAARTKNVTDDVRRGFIAQAAQLVGLRGAALSANAAFIAAAATAIGVAASLVQFSKFQSTLNTFRVTAGATAKQMGDVRKEAEALGKDITLPGVGAQDAADAMTELSKAGLSVQDSIAGARGVLQLATAASIDNAQATELAASALNAFGLSGNQAVHVADVLANASNDAQGSIVDIGLALQQAAAVGRQAGLSLEQTTAALTLFARNGLKGSDAGTSFRTAMIRLINPTTKAQKVIDQLGLHVRTSTGAINLGVFDEFTKKTQNFTKAARDQALAIIFGQDAIRGAAILAREGASGLEAEQRSLEKQGTAAKLAGARMAGLSGDVENFKNQLSALGLAIGSATAPLAGKFVQALTRGTIFLERATKAATVFFQSDLFHAARFDSVKHGFDETAAAAAKLQRDLSTTGDFAFKLDFAVGLKAAVKDLGTEGKKLVDQGFLTRVVETFVKLSPLVKKAMEDNVISPAEQAQLSQDALGQAFLAATGLGTKGFASLGAVAKSSIEDASAGVRASAPRLGQAMKDTIEEASALAKAQAAQSGLEVGDKIVFGIEQSLKLAGNRLNRIINGAARQARLKTGALQSQALDLQIQGASPQDRLKNAKAQQAQAQTLLDIGVGKGLDRKTLDQRKQDLIDAQNLVKGIQGEIEQNATDAANKAKKAASDAKEKAKTIADARDAADQAILDAFAPKREGLSRADIRAQATETLKDNIAVQVALANIISAEIATITKTVKNAKTKAAQISSRVTELVQVGVNLDDLRQRQAQAEIDLATNKFETRLGLAQATGAPQSVLLKIFDRRITQLNKEIAAAKKDGRSTDALRTALATAANDRRQVIDDFLAKQTELAKAKFGDADNKSPIITALNKEIANKRKEIAQAKKAGKSTLDLRIELQNLINDRQSILDDAKKADQGGKGTTAFDLLTEFNTKFKDIAGNFVTPSGQPFAGSSDFLDSIVGKATSREFSGPFLDKALSDQQKRNQITSPGGQKMQLQLSDDLLIAALDRLTTAVTGTGNSSTINTTPGEGTAWSNRASVGAFWAARQAREVKDG